MIDPGNKKIKKMAQIFATDIYRTTIYTPPRQLAFNDTVPTPVFIIYEPFGLYLLS